MCGIVALFAADRRPVDKKILLSMRDSIVHRGPDDCGHFLAEGIGLGHRRLSIIDLSTGHQPMSDSSDHVWIVFNGEIYNYRNLRDQYSQRGYQFKTFSDTEVIIASYLLNGDRFVEPLNGIFSFALWDSRCRRLVLVRDRLGVKPLYIWQGEGLLAAASEIKALLKLPEVEAQVDWEAVPEYLAFRHLSGNRTLFKGIRSLGPGEVLVAEDNKLETKTYWRLPRSVDEASTASASASHELNDLLEDACRLQLISDVPLGTYNSGGVDSSLVTAIVAPDRTEALNTYCVGLSEPGFDERPFAEVVAQRYGTQHHTILVDNIQFADALPNVVWHHDEPLNHPNTVPMYLLSREAKKRVTVVLTGEGADELFAGYPRYRIGAALQALGPWGQSLLRPLVSLVPTWSKGRISRAITALKSGPPAAIVEGYRYVSDAELAPILSGDWQTIGPDRLPSSGLQGSLVSRMLEHDQRNYLVSVLNRLDKASMAFAVEARVPILDHRLVEFAASIPPSLKLHRWETKYLVKKVAQNRLPKEVIYRRKSGLALPLLEWFQDRQGLGRYLEMMLEPRSLQRGFLNTSGIKSLVKGVETGHPGQTDLAWALINLELWLRDLVDSNSR